MWGKKNPTALLKTFQHTPGNRTGGRYGMCVSSFTRHHQMFFKICANLCLYRINESLCFSPFLTLLILWHFKIFAYLMGVKNSILLLLSFTLDWLLVRRTFFSPIYLFAMQISLNYLFIFFVHSSFEFLFSCRNSSYTPETTSESVIAFPHLCLRF